jgi:Tfp pilus assembly protein PilV
MLHKSSYGFSLLETLAALGILLLSVLGVYRLQLFTSHHIHFAYSAGQVYELALEASRRISNNSEALISYLNVEIESAQKVDCNPCSSQQLAGLDLYHLRLSLEQIESGAAMIEQCVGINALCLKASWSDTDLKQCEDSESCIEQVIYYLP